jgi:hypothetical protein
LLATALLVAATLGGSPDLSHAVAPAARTMSVQRSGFPKLYRCASPIARPQASADASPACNAWRDRVLAEIAALPAPERIARVAALRLRMGLAPGSGLGVGLDGTIRPATVQVAAR